MKSPLRKLCDLAVVHHRDHPEEKRRKKPYSQIDELEQASQDMQDMKDCYDSLFSAAAAATNSAYEFSEALKDLGTCLLQKASLSDDEESGRVLLQIGKTQFQLQKLVDNYRSHVFQTISTPSQSLLSELRTVEEMKRQCDEKREILDYMLASSKEKGKPKNSKGRPGLSQQLQLAHEAYEEEASLFVFRLKSLKQGQSRSLLTQATRHHAAQLNLFRKGNKFLEAVEPDVKLIAEQQHINYQFSGLEDDGSEGEDDYSYEANNDSELSFDYEQIERGPDVDSTSRSSMELDKKENPSAPTLNADQMMGSMDNRRPAFSRTMRTGPGSYSAPIFLDRRIDFSEKTKELQPPKKLHSYVLPTPSNSQSLKLARSDAVQVTRVASAVEKPAHLWHSSPLQTEKNGRSGDGQVSASPHSSEAKSMLEENKKSPQVPPPLSEQISLLRCSVDMNPNAKKIKRQAFSGPLTNKVWPSKTVSSSLSLSEYPSRVHIVPAQGFTRQRSSHKVVFGASQSLMCNPIISEPHELPRPPLLSARSARPYSMTVPLMYRSPDDTLATRWPNISRKASPLPKPPGTIARSFSIPSSSQRSDLLSATPRLSLLQSSYMNDDIASPKLSPMSPTCSRFVSGTVLDSNDPRMR